MIIKCKDGDLQVPEMLMNLNPGANRLCNSSEFLKAAREKSMLEVFNRIQSEPWG